MAETKKQVWLIRHGETEWSQSGRHTGRTDLPLNEAGRERAESVGRHLGGRAFALVLTSPLQRAAETCRLSGYGEVMQPTTDLEEWDYGAYEGRTTADIRKERPGWFLWRDGVVNGEAVDEVGRRADRVIARAEATEGDVALFSHGHMLRVLGARWLNLDADGGRLFALGTAALSVLGYEHEVRVFLIWNQDSHLAKE